MDLNKISKGFTYLVATDSAAPPPPQPIPKPKSVLHTPGSKSSRKWERRRVRWKLQQLDNAAVAKAIKENEAYLDSAATSNFSNDTTNLTLTGPSDKRLAVADGHIINATHTAKLPLPSLVDEARTTTIVPELAKSLLSVAVLADNGYTTIFRPYGQGAEVYAKDACDITAS